MVGSETVSSSNNPLQQELTEVELQTLQALFQETSEALYCPSPPHSSFCTIDRMRKRDKCDEENNQNG
jgi:hypothetical protein